MPVTLEQDLKAFEKELSLLLVRFMKICDAVEAARPHGSKGPTAPERPMPAKKPSTDFGRAYA